VCERDFSRIEAEPGVADVTIKSEAEGTKAEQAAAPDRGRSPASRTSTSHQRPRQVSWSFGGIVEAI